MFNLAPPIPCSPAVVKIEYLVCRGVISLKVKSYNGYLIRQKFCLGVKFKPVFPEVHQ